MGGGGGGVSWSMMFYNCIVSRFSFSCDYAFFGRTSLETPPAVSEFVFLTLGACATVIVVVLCVCLSVYYHANCYIPRLPVQPAVFLMAFQTHDLYGFRRKCFVGQFWRHLLLSFLTSFCPALCYDFTYK